MSEISKLENNLIIKKIDKKTVHIQITDNEMLMSIVGQFDQNLKNLASLTKTNIFFSKGSILSISSWEIMNCVICINSFILRWLRG